MNFTEAYAAMKQGMKVVPLGTTKTVLKYDEVKQAIVIDAELSDLKQDVVMPMVHDLIEAEYVEYVPEEQS